MTETEQLREENDRLRARLKELRSRLREPEEIIRAIRDGEVDAFVVEEPRGHQVYALRSADVLYRGMIEDMKEGAVALDASGLIVYCNAYFAQLVKAERPTLLGASLFPFVPLESRSFFEGLHEKSVRGTTRRELALRTGDGELVPVFATMNRIRIDGGDVFCLILADLRDQKKRDELLLESERKDQFLAMLAHELRNPIAPIRNAAQILRLKGPAEPRVQWAREVIDRQVTQLTRLVDDLLDVSRITRGKIRLELEQVGLAQVVARAVETARPHIEARHHELTIELPPEPILIQVDVTRISQVLSNLLNNAAKFTTERGKIWVTARLRDKQVEIAIRDTGIGISAEMVPRIFDLFTQVDATLERSQGGLGIGLTLVRSLVELHAGSVEARSDGLGQGSEFLVRLPIVTANGQQPRGDGQSGSLTTSCPPHRILVIDDNLDSAQSLSVLIEHWGHEVMTVTDGESALEAARSFRPQVMFVDIGLPGIDGYEIVRRVRRMPGLEGVVLIALTGYGQEEDRRRSQDAGFDHHWVKPLDVSALEAFWLALAAKDRRA
jgi:PAS domain S-box-containing protein